MISGHLGHHSCPTATWFPVILGSFAAYLMGTVQLWGKGTLGTDKLM